jgi:hypothetical protein
MKQFEKPVNEIKQKARNPNRFFPELTEDTIGIIYPGFSFYKIKTRDVYIQIELS